MLAIVDYRAGNLTSVRLALESIGVVGTISSDPETILRSDRIIFPGVGAAGAAMNNLCSLGLDEVLREAVHRGTPLLGICLGMQILLDYSEEDGGTEMLGFIPGRVVRFQPKNHWEKIPQIGWNQVELTSLHRSNRLFSGISSGSDFYFVHSFYPEPRDEENVVARTPYAGTNFASVLQRDNIVATQYHPEKSGAVGMKLLENFVKNF